MDAGPIVRMGVVAARFRRFSPHRQPRLTESGQAIFAAAETLYILLEETDSLIAHDAPESHHLAADARQHQGAPQTMHTVPHLRRAEGCFARTEDYQLGAV